MEAEITNALIRCSRPDQAARSAFELVIDERDLWVRELPANLTDIIADLLEVRPLLKQLGTGSSDYTMHLAATIDDHHSLVLPPPLIKIAGECGFAIELISTPVYRDK